MASAVRIAASGGQASILSVLVQKATSEDSFNRRHYIAIPEMRKRRLKRIQDLIGMCAARRRQQEIVWTAIDNSANLLVWGKVIYCAVSYKHEEVLCLILERIPLRAKGNISLLT
jgi:hypothetical protein